MSNVQQEICPFCGKVTRTDGNFCTECGHKIEGIFNSQTAYRAKINKESVEKTMDNKLIACLTNIKKGTRSFIEGDCYEIGTDIENDLCLTGKFISRNHAKIIVENGKYYLIDCNSKNGTFINSVRIPVGNPVEIFNNSEIYFADECFIFTVER